MSKEQILHEALALDIEEREELVAELQSSLSQDDAAEIERVWMEEAERRLDAILDGRSKPLDGPEFMKKLRASR